MLWNMNFKKVEFLGSVYPDITICLLQASVSWNPDVEERKEMTMIRKGET